MSSPKPKGRNKSPILLESRRSYPSESHGDTSPTNEAILSPAAINDVSGIEEGPADEDDQMQWRRFQGPNSTWRDWTAEERRIAHSLDQLRAQDLSIHLFNTHALRSRAHKIRTAESNWQNPISDRKPWEPHSNWACWPLEMDAVPREGREGWARNDNNTNASPYAVSGMTSRQVLEEILVGIASERARFIFQNRESGISRSLFANRTQNDGMFQGNTDLGPKATGNRGSLSPSSVSNASEHLSTSSADCKSKEAPASSRPVSPRADRNMSVETREYHHNNQTPEFMADDSQIALLLRKPARHILSKVDLLLAGLHHSRSSYTNRNYDGWSDDDDELDGQTSGSEAQPKSKRRHRSNIQEGRPASTSSSISEYSVASSTLPASMPDVEPQQIDRNGRVGLDRGRSSSRRSSRIGGYSSQSASQHRRSPRQQYKPRDWSDVLGMAAVTGWDGSVVRRAQQRCEELFDERMDFVDVDTILNEGAQTTTERSSAEQQSEDEVEEGIHVDGFLRPVKRRKGWRGKDAQKRRKRDREENVEKAWKVSRTQKTKRRARPHKTTESMESE